MTTTVRRHADAYHDSMLLMAATRALTASPGVDWGTALMATPLNVELLAEQGVDARDARANDLLLVARAGSPEDAMCALDAAEAVLAGTRAVERDLTMVRPPTITAAVADLAGANVAVVSVPGPYAALAAHQALSAGMDVLLFSDGVSVDDEVALKIRAESLGRLVMGPGAGTAVLGGVGLGFANAVSPGRVGVVAAAGTGAQEVLALLTAGGSGVAAVIGVGGRDLSRAVGGRMTRAALHLLATQADVDVLLLVTKPPDPDVLASVLPAAGGKPLVIVAQGAEELQTPAKVQSVRTIDEGVEAALTELGMPAPSSAPACAPWLRRRSSAWTPSASPFAGCSPAAASATRRCMCSPGDSGRSTRTRRCSRAGAYRHLPAPMCASTRARRNSRFPGRTR